MAYIDFLGKNSVKNPRKISTSPKLVKIPHKSIGREERPLDGNLIIHGDNIDALTALRSSFSEFVKCVYIDPPYNTGWKGWVYRDTPQQSNSCMAPKNRRRDHWLCGMAATLQRIRDLMLPEGLLLVSIDAHEMFYLAILCDEIFGEANRLGVIVVRNNPRGRRLHTKIAVEHEYLLAYAKDAGAFTVGRLPVDSRRLDDFPLSDADGRRFRLLGLRKRGAFSSRRDRPNLHYPLYVDTSSHFVSAIPGDGLQKILPIRSDGSEGVWRWSSEKVRQNVKTLTARIVKKEMDCLSGMLFRSITLIEEQAGVYSPLSGKELNLIMNWDATSSRKSLADRSLIILNLLILSKTPSGLPTLVPAMLS